MKKNIVVTLLHTYLLLLFTSFASAQDEIVVQMDRLYESGMKAYHADKYEKAAAYLNDGMKIAKRLKAKDYIGKFADSIGVVHRDLGQYEKA